MIDHQATMHGSRAKHITRGIAAAVALAGLLIGMPVTMAAEVGWPLPHRVPAARHVAHLLAGPIPDGFWPRALAVVGWIVWAWFATCVGIEAYRAARGRNMGRTHSMWGPHGLASVLFMAVLALATKRAPAYGAAPAPQSVPAASAAPATTVATGAIPSAYTVAEGDSLWSIAQRFLGDGTRYMEIADANFQRVQPDGRRLADVSLIYPGWQLAIPQSAGAPAVPNVMSAPAAPDASPATLGSLQALPAPPGDVQPADASSPTVGPAAQAASGVSGEDRSQAAAVTTVLTPSAEPALSPGSPEARRSAVAAPVASTRPALTGVPTTAEVATSAPKSSRTLPTSAPADLGPRSTSVPKNLDSRTIPAPLSHSPEPQGSPGDAGGSDPRGSSRPASTSSRDHVHPHSSRLAVSTSGGPPVGVELFGLGFLGGSALVVLDRRRRRTLSRRQPGMRISTAPLGSPAASLEQRLRRASAPTSTDVVAVAGRLLSHACRLSARRLPKVAGLHVARREVTFIVDGEAGEPAPPFTSGRSGGAWSIGVSEAFAQAGAAGLGDEVSIAFIPVGRDGEGEVFVNLDSAASFEIACDTESLPGRLDAILLGCLSAPGVAGRRVVVVGAHSQFGDCAMEVGHPADALALVEQSPSVKTVVIVAATGGDAGLDDLLALAATSTMLRVVAVGSAPRCALSFDADNPVIANLPLSDFQPAHGDEDQRQALIQLIDSASRLVELPAAPAAPFTAVSEPAGHSNQAVEICESRIEIGVLGPMTITISGRMHRLEDFLAEGIARYKRRSIKNEMNVAVYLAMHAPAVSRDRVLDAFTSDSTSSWTKHYASTVLNRLRRMFEEAAGVGEYFTCDVPSQRYLVSDTITTDLTRFMSLSSSGNPDADRTALALVRGKLCENLPSPSWLTIEGIEAEVSARIADLAHRVAEAALAAGDLEEASWAARAGLHGAPYEESLYSIRMRCAKSARELDRIWNELLLVLDVGDDPDGELMAETVATYRTLRHTPRARVVIDPEELERVGVA